MKGVNFKYEEASIWDLMEYIIWGDVRFCERKNNLNSRSLILQRQDGKTGGILKALWKRTQLRARQ